MITHIGYGTYLVFMGFMIFAMFWSWFILPELRGLALEDVDRYVPRQAPLCRALTSLFPRLTASSATPLVPRTVPAASVSPARSVSTRSSSRATSRTRGRRRTRRSRLSPECSNVEFRKEVIDSAACKKAPR